MNIEERNRIVENNMGLVGKMLSQYRKNYSNSFVITNDDLYQVGCVALIKAAESYDDSKGAAFSTYACSAIWNAFRREQEKTKGDDLKIDNKGYTIEQLFDYFSKENDTSCYCIHDTPDQEIIESLRVTMDKIQEKHKHCKSYELGKQAILLLYEGFDIKTAASILGEPYAKVKSAVHQARVLHKSHKEAFEWI